MLNGIIWPDEATPEIVTPGVAVWPIAAVEGRLVRDRGGERLEVNRGGVPVSFLPTG